MVSKEKEYLILKWMPKIYFFKYIKGIKINSLYITNNEKVFKYLYHKKNKVFLRISKRKIHKAKKIIIFDTMVTPLLLKKIKRINPNVKIYIYFWNVVNQYNQFLLTDKNIDYLYTFDEEEAKKHSIKFNKQFYTNNIKLKTKKTTFDVCFLGRAKDRKDKIIDIENKLKAINLKTDFKIIEKEKDFVSYPRYLKMIENSSCILDIVNSNQIGLSLRCMESLFFEKKLITNNSNIKNYDFYNPNNIFILGIDNIKKIENFLKKSYCHIDRKKIMEYDISNWLKHFDE